MKKLLLTIATLSIVSLSYAQDRDKVDRSQNEKETPEKTTPERTAPEKSLPERNIERCVQEKMDGRTFFERHLLPDNALERTYRTECELIHMDDRPVATEPQQSLKQDAHNRNN